MIAEVILILLVVLWLAYKYCTSEYGYWKDRSVAYVEPHFPFGSEKDLILRTVCFGDHFQNHYNNFKGEKLIGAFMMNRPFLIVRDPDLIRHIMVKDFHHFVDRGLIDPDLMSPVNRTLFIIDGEYWRNMRSKLSPAFTSGKMKMMFHLMEDCAEQFRKALIPVAEKNETIDVKDFLARFTTDVISTCAFGLESNSINNPDSEFRINGKKIFQIPPLPQRLQQQFAFLLPNIYRFLRIPPIANGSEGFFKKIVNDTVEYREKNGVVRNDFIDLLLKIKHNKKLSDDDTRDAGNGTNTNVGDAKEGLTLDEMTAQSLVFFSAGFETAASTTSFCLYELSVNPDIQERLHEEVSDVLQRYSGKFTYQALQEMPYLDAVVNETLRRYASLPFLNRKCTEDYKFPDSNLVIPKGTALIIPTHAIHHDPEYYPDPYKFNPERFMGDATKTKNNFTFLPFGEGPRMCIGNRFGLLQVKTCLSTMINSFQISLSEDTPVPVKIDKEYFVTTPESPIVLKISKRANA